jgi:glycosyltransferase involved in cell wall biosynthesis
MSKFQFQSEALGPKSVPEVRRRRVRPAAFYRSKLRMVMVGMHLTKTRGGITTLTTDILESRLGRKFDITYIASQAEAFGKIGKIILAAVATIRFAAVCIWKRPDLAYIHVGSNASLYRESAFILLAKLLGRRTIAHFHAGDVRMYLPGQPSIGRKFIRWALSHSDRIIAVSAESLDDLREMLPFAEITLLPNAIDFSWLCSHKANSMVDSEDDKVRLLFVGAVGKLKGEADLISALALLQQRNFDIKTSFLGYGAERLADICVHAGVSELVEHLGPVALTERAAFFQRADIFVLPTYAEAMPISVIEAMAAGLPIVTTPVGGIPEIIEDGKEGFLFPCGDVRAMADSIGRLVKDKDLRLRMGLLAKKRAKDQMDFEDYIERLEGEIEQVRLA